MLKKIFVLFLFLSVNFSCQQYQITQDMLRFDQAFIPINDYIIQGKMHRAKAAIPYLDFQWVQLAKKYEEVAWSKDWDNTVIRVESWLEDAYVALEGNERFLAKVQLEHARYELMAFRERNQIAYFLDRLYEFEMAWDVVDETIRDPMLCLYEWNEFKQLVRNANNAWIKVYANTPEASFFKLDTEEMDTYIENRDLVTKHLAYFNEAVDCAEMDLIQPHALRVYPALRATINLFGNFKTSETHFASTDKINTHDD